MEEEEPARTTLALGESGGRAAEIQLRYLARHGVIAGSTGTGKSRAMQVLAEQAADAGIHVFVSDVKGDASGFCAPAFEQSDEPTDAEKKWNGRNSLAPFEPASFGANYWSVSGRFARMRFSVGEAGSVLFSRLLSLNPTQESHLAIAFSYARKAGRPLDTVDQLLDVLDEMVRTGQRGISPSSVSVIERKIIALNESGLDNLFGKPSLQVRDLGGLNVLNLSDARRDMAVSIAPAFLLQKLFNVMPEVGDQEKPQFLVFFDEAHYLFKDANKSLRDLMVTMLKQIRSKGVAVFFVTQDVTDLPEEILSQLSTKVIFSQKVFTEKGAQRLRALAKSFPQSKLNLDEKLKTMPPGVCILSTLDESGNQTPPAEVKVFAPATTMEVVPDDVLRKATDPELIRKYSKSENPRPLAKPSSKAASAPPASRAPVRESPQKEPRPAPLPAEKPVSKAPEKKAAAREQVRVKEIIVEKKVVRKTGPGILDGILGALLKLLDFILKAGAKIVTAVLIKPLVSLYRYLTKKPVRILFLLVFLLVLYVIFINWGAIQGALDAMKLG
ncbi:MAG TPA: helicase HerA-like domain-containing protein [Candidatus Bilamarchaeum sp.]|nr:helicase HerA-like domain-containing protein [Candidatus Bilamarchaeum sp.]